MVQWLTCLEAAGVTRFEEFVRVRDLKDFWPKARRSTFRELRETERKLGVRLPRILKLVLREVGAIMVSAYQLADTDPESETSIVAITHMVRELNSELPRSFICIGVEIPEPGKIRFVGLLMSPRSRRCRLVEWDPNAKPGEELQRQDPQLALRDLLRGMDAEGEPDRSSLPGGLRPVRAGLVEWLRDDLDRLYSFATPGDWHDRGAWERYHRRGLRMRRGLGSWSSSDRVFRDLHGQEPDLPVLFPGNGVCREPLALCEMGWHAIALDIADAPLEELRRARGRRRDQERARALIRNIEQYATSSPDQTTNEMQSALRPNGRLETVRSDIFEYEPGGPLRAIVCNRLHYGFPEEELNHLIERFARWLAPGGTCYVFTSVGDGNDLLRDHSAWARRGFLLRDAGFMEQFHFARNARAEGKPEEWIREQLIRMDNERLKRERVHRQSGGRFLDVCFGE